MFSYVKKHSIKLEKQNVFNHNYNRIDRSKTKKQWAKLFSWDLKMYDDVHTMQDVEGLFSRYNFLQELMKQLFNRRVELFVDKYTLEFTDLLDIILDRTYKYLD